jgi:hypothetical protein
LVIKDRARMTTSRELDRSATSAKIDRRQIVTHFAGLVADGIAPVLISKAATRCIAPTSDVPISPECTGKIRPSNNLQDGPVACNASIIIIRVAIVASFLSCPNEPISANRHFARASTGIGIVLIPIIARFMPRPCKSIPTGGACTRVGAIVRIVLVAVVAFLRRLKYSIPTGHRRTLRAREGIDAEPIASGVRDDSHQIHAAFHHAVSIAEFLPRKFAHTLGRNRSAVACALVAVRSIRTRTVVLPSSVRATKPQLLSRIFARQRAFQRARLPRHVPLQAAIVY